MPAAAASLGRAPVRTPLAPSCWTAERVRAAGRRAGWIVDAMHVRYQSATAAAVQVHATCHVCGRRCLLSSMPAAAETAFIDTLRTHYTRNGTAESFAPKFAKSPTKTYSRNHHSSTCDADGGSGSGTAVGVPRGGLVQQERALWEEREEELVDAQVSRTPVGVHAVSSGCQGSACEMQLNPNLPHGYAAQTALCALRQQHSNHTLALRTLPSPTGAPLCAAGGCAGGARVQAGGLPGGELRGWLLLGRMR